MKTIKKRFNFWKSDIKVKERVKICENTYIHKLQYEQQADYKKRKNDAVSFAILKHCITIYYRKLPKNSEKIAPNFSTCINLRFLNN